MPTPTTASSIRRALISVSDKSGAVEFAARLVRLGFEIISTGGTAAALRQAGLPIREVAEITEFPEMLDGRVKTLHPRIHGGLLGRSGHAPHRKEMAGQGIVPIEVLAVNLYPFEAMAARARSAAGVEFADLIENIDIGGPAMLRSAAKNFESVAVVTDPGDYDAVAGELEQSGAVSLPTRWRLAKKAFARTAAYDAAITSTLAAVAEPVGAVHLGESEFAARLQLDAPLAYTLRYGENPHQRAALYRNPAAGGGVAQGELLQGKELSYNNLVDLDAAWELAQEFDAATPAVAIIKHTNPCGCATGASLHEAYQRALEADPVSAFGSVIGINRELDEETAGAMAELFIECIAAPGFSPAARARLEKKKNLRLLRTSPEAGAGGAVVRSISGGYLVQSRDQWTAGAGRDGWKVVTRRAPSPEEEAGLRFGWVVAKHVKSNAIVLARAGQTLSVGAGQMSRVDAVKLAGLRAQLPLAGSVVASDAFFPFADGIEEAARLGATAVIQPGGSVRDEQTIAVCDQLGLAMVFSGTRHFRH